MPRHAVSIVIPCFNKVEYTLRCLESLVSHTPGGRYEVIVVDNGSTDGTPNLCSQLEGDVVVIRNEENLGFSMACNQGAAAASGEHLLFLNNDTEALPGWLEPLLHILDTEPDVGAVGSKLLFPDGTVQHAGVITHEVEGGPIGAVHDHYRRPSTWPASNERRDHDVVTGACVAVRRIAFELAGGFDEGYWNGNEDVDLCLQLRAAGWRVVYEPASVLYHHESVSGPERFRRVDDNVRRLTERWRGRYAPEWMLTTSECRRPHPRRVRTEIVISGPPVRSLELERTVTAALRALRADDGVCIDPMLDPVPSLLRGPVRVGEADPGFDLRLLLDPSMRIDRGALDHLTAMVRITDAIAAGPIISDGRGHQAIDSWLTDAPRGTSARRRALPSVLSARVTDELDPRCVMHRLHHRPPGSRLIVVGNAYAECAAPVRSAVRR